MIMTSTDAITLTINSIYCIGIAINCTTSPAQRLNLAYVTINSTTKNHTVTYVQDRIHFMLQLIQLRNCNPLFYLHLRLHALSSDMPEIEHRDPVSQTAGKNRRHKVTHPWRRH